MINISFASGQCVLGAFLVARSEHGICAILLGDDARRLARELRRQFPQAHLHDAAAQLEPLVSKVSQFLAAPAGGLDVPLDAQGTAFQRRVWSALQEIPAGATESYGEVARRRKDGALAGYRWGVERKRALLLAEKAQA